MTHYVILDNSAAGLTPAVRPEPPRSEAERRVEGLRFLRALT
jgi:hypothetical protein